MYQNPYYYDYYDIDDQSMYPMYPQQPTYPGYPNYPKMPEGNQPMVPEQPMVPIPTSPEREQGVNVPGLMPVEQSYIENILRLNLGKMATIYMTFENNKEWNAKVFKGRLEAAGRDHIIISDPQTGKRYLLLMVNLDYITFDEELRYEPPTIPGR